MKKRGWTRRDAFRVSGSLAASSLAASGAGKKENVYTRIGVRPFINLTATYTINGGGLTLPEVKHAMDEASRYSVNLDELMEKVGPRIASLLGAEAAIVTAGCAAAMAHATAGIIAGADPEKIQQLPDLRGLRNQVLIARQSRNQYDHAFRSVGVKLIEYDTAEEFSRALGERVALVAVLGTAEAQGKLRLEQIAEAAHARGVPVVVDAAAELPLVPNPYLSRGADLAGYSGGKYLRGPQCAGLLLGRRDLVQAAWLNSAPHHAFGRAMKAGKEEIMGMLAAIEVWKSKQCDPQSDYRVWESWLRNIAASVEKIDSVTTRLRPPAGASPFPVLELSWNPAKIAMTAEEIGRQLLEGSPRIMSHAGGRGSSFIIRPVAMQEGDDKLVAARLAAILRSPPARDRREAPPAIDLSGAWKLKIDFTRGSAEHRLELASANGSLKGKHYAAAGSGAVTGTVRGTEIAFRSEIPCEGTRLTYYFEGAADAGRMSGEVSLGEYGRARWTAVPA